MNINIKLIKVAIKCIHCSRIDYKKDHLKKDLFISHQSRNAVLMRTYLKGLNIP